MARAVHSELADMLHAAGGRKFGEISVASRAPKRQIRPSDSRQRAADVDVPTSRARRTKRMKKTYAPFEESQRPQWEGKDSSQTREQQCNGIAATATHNQVRAQVEARLAGCTWLIN